jgi:hypothetical protein
LVLEQIVFYKGSVSTVFSISIVLSQDLNNKDQSRFRGFTVFNFTALASPTRLFHLDIRAAVSRKANTGTFQLQVTQFSSVSIYFVSLKMPGFFLEVMEARERLCGLVVRVPAC